MIRTFDDLTNSHNSISSEEMLILQARILARAANLVGNSKFLEIFPAEELLGEPQEDELERLHHYFDNALKNNSDFEITPVIAREISTIPQRDKDRFVDGMFDLVQKEELMSAECEAYIIKVAECFQSHHALVRYRGQAVIEVSKSEEKEE